MTDEETELRALLERAVPQLPSPAQRLERVRERVRRRRRRRAAGLSGTVVLAVAAAGLLLSAVGRTSGAPDAPGRSTALAPPASDEPAPTASGTFTLAPGYHLYSFARLAGLQLLLPVKWFTLASPDTATQYLSSQPLGLPPNECVQPLDDFCTPLVGNLAKGGVLLKLELQYNPTLAGKTRQTSQRVVRQSVLTACRAVGGTEQLGAVIADDAGSDELVVATACLSHPTDAQDRQIRDALTNADFT